MEELAQRALTPDWQAALLFRWITRRMTRKQAASAAGITLYAVDKINRTRTLDGKTTIVYTPKEWRDL